jgi:hypothetical protein
MQTRDWPQRQPLDTQTASRLASCPVQPSGPSAGGAPSPPEPPPEPVVAVLAPPPQPPTASKTHRTADIHRCMAPTLARSGAGSEPPRAQRRARQIRRRSPGGESHRAAS